MGDAPGLEASRQGDSGSCVQSMFVRPQSTAKLADPWLNQSAFRERSPNAASGPSIFREAWNSLHSKIHNTRGKLVSSGPTQPYSVTGDTLQNGSLTTRMRPKGPVC